jgi:hypothetical protein
MKKLLFVLTLMIVALASCNKSYVCECKDTTGAVAYTTNYTKFNKMHAKQACKNDASNTGYSCALK